MKYTFRFLLFSLFLLPSFISAQSYDLAFGLRLGTDLGISGQLRLPPLGENFTVETILQTSLQREEGMFSLLAEQHYPLITRRINIYAGGGLHAGWQSSKIDEIDAYKNPFGITGVIGAEFTLGRFNISYDFKPAINLSGGEKTVYSQTAVTVRYVAFKRFDIFESPRQKRKRQRQKVRDQKRKDRGNSSSDSWKFWKRRGS